MSVVETLLKIGDAVVTLGPHVMDLKDRLSGFSKAEVQVSANETEITIRWSGGSFNSDHLGKFGGVTSSVSRDARGNEISMKCWKWGLEIREDAGWWTDGLTIRGYVKHVCNPHPGDTQPAETLDFSFIVNADNTQRVTQTGSNSTHVLDITGANVGKSAAHPMNSVDQVTNETFSATIDSGYNQDDFTGYTWSITVKHIKPKETPPKEDRREPTSESGPKRRGRPPKSE